MTMLLRWTTIFSALLVFSAPLSAQNTVPSGSRLKSIADKKIVRIAYRADATPFSFQKDKGEPVGYSIDLCRSIVKSFERQYGLQNLKMEWIPVTAQTRFSAVAGGKADMECGSSTITLGRSKEVDFSSIIFVESTGIAVKASSNIRSFADLSGRRVAVVSGTTNEQVVLDKIRERKMIAFTNAVKDRETGLAVLRAGDVDGYASDKLMLVGGQMLHPNEFTILPEDLSVEPYAVVLPRADWALRVAVNAGLAEVFRSDQINDLFRRWFEPIGLQPTALIKAAYTLGALAN